MTIPMFIIKFWGPMLSLISLLLVPPFLYVPSKLVVDVPTSGYDRAMKQSLS